MGGQCHGMALDAAHSAAVPMAGLRLLFGQSLVRGAKLGSAGGASQQVVTVVQSVTGCGLLPGEQAVNRS